MLRTFTLISLLFCSGLVQGQNQVDSLIDLAQTQANNANYQKALELYTTSLSYSKDRWDDSRIYYRMAYCFRSMNNLESATEYLKRSIAKDRYDLEAIYELAIMLRESDRIKEATRTVKRYIRKSKEHPMRGKGQALLTGMKMSEAWLANPEPFSVSVNRQLSSSSMEFAPMFVDKTHRVLMFSSNRHVVNGETDAASRTAVYLTKKNGADWTAPTRLDTSVNRNGAEGAVSFDHHRNVIFFTRCDHHKCGLWYAFLKGEMAGESFPIRFADQAEFGATFGHPSYSDSLKALFFVSDMPGGFGGKDIYVSYYSEKTDSWNAPQNLGQFVNSEGDEMFPSIQPNGDLYFSSSGRAGLGGLDIFKVVPSNDPRILGWVKPTNLGFPLNSKGDDFGIIFLDSISGYFTSNRSGGLGSDDIYSFALTQNISKLEDDSTAIFLHKALADSSLQSNLDGISKLVNQDVCEKKEETSMVMNTTLYPNPNSGQFNLQVSAPENLLVTLKVYSNLGQLVETRSCNLPKGQTELNFDLHDVPKGIYYVQLLQGCETFSINKFILN
ncbi:MAG: T9SS type A sorting domain-containing protein [Flavobacteriales bacterium]|nr:T9SS type A sorting domain-containing protein [Flavobacteriales bacterium]